MHVNGKDSGAEHTFPLKGFSRQDSLPWLWRTLQLSLRERPCHQGRSWRLREERGNLLYERDGGVGLLIQRKPTL